MHLLRTLRTKEQIRLNDFINAERMAVERPGWEVHEHAEQDITENVPK